MRELGASIHSFKALKGQIDLRLANSARKVSIYALFFFVISYDIACAAPSTLHHIKLRVAKEQL